MLLVVVRFGHVIFGSIKHFVSIVHVDDKQAVSDENYLTDQNYLVEGRLPHKIRFLLKSSTVPLVL